ncbi:MAG: DUF2157 domain-containing protein [Pseudomonadota bacterium]
MAEGGESTPSSLSASLGRWRDAGLISADQAQAIVTFESAREPATRRGAATRAVALLGGLTLVSGVGSLVAYNWDVFGGAVKLAAIGVLLLLAFAYTLRVRRADGTSTALDVGLVITFGLTLASLALVSQIYAQDGELWVLMFAWSALTAPLMSFARTRFANYLWYAGLAISLLSASNSLYIFVDERLEFSGRVASIAVVLVLGGLTWVLAARFAASLRPGRAAAGGGFYRLHFYLIGLFGSLFSLGSSDGHPILWAIGLVMGGAVLLATPRDVAALRWRSRPTLLALVALGIVLALIPLGLDVRSDYGAFIAFASFVLFWGAVAYVADRSGEGRRARIAVGLLAIRVVVASFELFESLLVTGVVLVSLGACALLWSRLAWSSKPAGETP